MKKACVAAPAEVAPEVMPEVPSSEGLEEGEETKKKGKIVCTEQDCNKVNVLPQFTLIRVKISC